ncbi:MAG: TraK family protein [Desulfovibrio sp.]|uniref:TraK family protein n=1 Tax=Desulfovibrio sp. TaxID=885 RepID=UPI00258B8797|nr:TraK family protein [Desulfovibrio sp.]MCD7984445.1 TraK family protein [Desulfovibrio sp.]
MTRLRWGCAKVEFIAVQPELQRLLAAGHSKKMVFEKLRESARITMSYTRFCELSKGKKKPPEDTRQSGPATPPESSKSAEDKATSLPAKQPTGAASSDKSTSPPATAEQVSAPARSGPRIVGGQKPVPFGEIKVDLDKAYGIESEKE